MEKTLWDWAWHVRGSYRIRESVQVFRVHVLSSCCHVWVLLALRCHFPPSMSQNYPQFHLIMPVAFYQVCSVRVVQRETSTWREATALENYSDNNRSHYWVDVCLQNASYQPLGVTAQQSFIPLQESQSPESLSFPKATFLFFFFWLFLLSSPLLCMFYHLLSFWPSPHTSNPIIFLLPTTIWNTLGLCWGPSCLLRWSKKL